MERPCIYVCGRLAIKCGATVVREADFPARQGRRLWAYLVVNRRWPVGRDALAEALWGDDLSDAWDVALNSLISRLRGVVRQLDLSGDNVGIRGEVGRYVLVLPGETFIDLERARRAGHESDRLMRLGDAGAALAEARVAMEIAGRGFLPGEDGAWIEGVRRTLTDLRLHAHQRTVEAELQRGNVQIAEREARDLVALAPLRESAYRLLIQALVAADNAAEASHVYDDCQRILWEEMGASPSPETERFVRRLVNTGGE